jgi:hypothetical protein
MIIITLLYAGKSLSNIKNYYKGQSAENSIIFSETLRKVPIKNNRI